MDLLSPGHCICYLVVLIKNSELNNLIASKIEGKEKTPTLCTLELRGDLVLPSIQDTHDKQSFGIHPCTNKSLPIQTCHNRAHNKQIWRSLWKATDTKTANKFHHTLPEGGQGISLGLRSSKLKLHCTETSFPPALTARAPRFNPEYLRERTAQPSSSVSRRRASAVLTPNSAWYLAAAETASAPATAGLPCKANQGWKASPRARENFLPRSTTSRPASSLTGGLHFTDRRTSRSRQYLLPSGANRGEFSQSS